MDFDRSLAFTALLEIPAFRMLDTRTASDVVTEFVEYAHRHHPGENLFTVAPRYWRVAEAGVDIPVGIRVAREARS